MRMVRALRLLNFFPVRQETHFVPRWCDEHRWGSRVARTLLSSSGWGCSIQQERHSEWYMGGPFAEFSILSPDIGRCGAVSGGHAEFFSAIADGMLDLSGGVVGSSDGWTVVDGPPSARRKGHFRKDL